MKLASNDEEYLLLELLPNVANKFLRNRRAEEYAAKQPKEEPKAVETAATATEAAEEPITGSVFRAPMGGRIIEVDVKAGDKVKKGQRMMVYEAMKMENDLEADRDLTVKRVFVKIDDVVGTDAPLIEFE